MWEIPWIEHNRRRIWNAVSSMKWQISCFRLTFWPQCLGIASSDGSGRQKHTLLKTSNLISRCLWCLSQRSNVTPPLRLHPSSSRVPWNRTWLSLVQTRVCLEWCLLRGSRGRFSPRASYVVLSCWSNTLGTPRRFPGASRVLRFSELHAEVWICMLW